jgi:ribosomal protein L11 methyltransferase
MVDWNTLVVEELLQDHGFQPIHRVQTEEWVTMAFQKMK